MGLWDVLSGKIARWNAVTQEANKTVCQRLNAFINESREKREESPDYLLTLRDEFYTFFTVAQRFLNVSLEEERQHLLRHQFQPLKDRIMALDLGQHMACVSIIHAEGAMLLYASKAEGLDGFWDRREGYDRYLGLLLEGVCQIYSRPVSFVESWQRCRDWLKPNSLKEFAPAVGRKAADEMGVILGAEIHPLESLFRQGWWSRCWEAIFTELKNPNWRNAIEEEMAADA